jgi:hypothetical protein
VKKILTKEQQHLLLSVTAHSKNVVAQADRCDGSLAIDTAKKLKKSIIKLQRDMPGIMLRLHQLDAAESTSAPDKTEHANGGSMKFDKTDDYSIFKIENNRDVSEPNVLRLVRSIRSHDHTMSHPISVGPADSDGRYWVFDGQHRLEACKRLGIPVYYIVDPNASQLSLEAIQTSKRWTAYDTLSRRAQESDLYAEMKGMADEIGLKSSFHVLLGHRVGGGTLNITDEAIATARKNFSAIMEIKSMCNDDMKRHKLLTSVRGLVALLTYINAGASIERISSQLNLRGTQLQIVDDLPKCFESFDQWYNHRLAESNRIHAKYTKTHKKK